MIKIFRKKSSKIFVITMTLLILLKILEGFKIPFSGFIFWGVLLVGFMIGAHVAEKE